MSAGAVGCAALTPWRAEPGSMRFGGEAFCLCHTGGVLVAGRGVGGGARWAPPARQACDFIAVLVPVMTAATKLAGQLAGQLHSDRRTAKSLRFATLNRTQCLLLTSPARPGGRLHQRAQLDRNIDRSSDLNTVVRTPACDRLSQPIEEPPTWNYSLNAVILAGSSTTSCMPILHATMHTQWQSMPSQSLRAKAHVLWQSDHVPNTRVAAVHRGLSNTVSTGGCSTFHSPPPTHPGQAIRRIASATQIASVTLAVHPRVVIKAAARLAVAHSPHRQ